MSSHPRGAALWISFVALSGAQTEAQEVAGVWQAEMPFGPTTIRLELEIRDSLDGLRGQFSNVTEDEEAFPIDLIEVDGPAIRLQSCALDFNPFVRVIGATYEGTLSDDASVIRGVLAQGIGRFPLEFRRATSSSPSGPEATIPPARPNGAGSGEPGCEGPARNTTERILETLPGLVERGDREEFRSFIAENFGQSMQTGGIERWVDVLSTFHHASHGFEYQGLQGAGTNWATARMRNRLTGDWVSVNVIAENESPHLMMGRVFVPATPPEPVSGPLSTGQIRRELEAYVDRLAGGDVFSGAVLLARDGEIVFEGAYGLADKDLETPNRIDTRFGLSSMTKMFTAVAIMQLAEAGKLSLDDTLSEYIPAFPDEASAGKIRIEHLLAHQAGFGDFRRNQRFVDSSAALYRTVDDFMTLAADEELEFEPGTRFQYSNTGFLVLGKVIEVVAGDDYYEYIREHVYEPAGMSNSDCYSREEIDPNLAIGYDRQYTDQGIAYTDDTYMGGRCGNPGGGSASTVHDLLAFSEALLGHELVSAESLTLMTSTNPDLNRGYGYGFEVAEEQSRIGHAGGSRGHYSNLDIFRDSGWTAIVLSNYSEGNVPAYPSIVRKIRELVGLWGQ